MLEEIYYFILENSEFEAMSSMPLQVAEGKLSFKLILDEDDYVIDVMTIAETLIDQIDVQFDIILELELIDTILFLYTHDN